MIRKSVKKTNQNDARALAFFLSKDMLPETRLKSVAESELASLVHTRDVLVKQRTRLLNEIHALYVRHGVKLKKESLSSKRALRGIEIACFSSLEQVQIKIVRDQALSPTGALAEIDAAIEGAAKILDGYDGVVSIKGIGPRSAAVSLSGTGTVADFESADKLAAYLGIVPRVSQSNDTDRRGRITKRGRRIKERRGAGKAIVATARKLLTVIYDTLRNGWVFQDFPAFKIAEKNNVNSIGYGQSS